MALTMRITEPTAKIAAVFAGMALTLMLAICIGMTTGSGDVASAVASVGSIATVLWCTRVFRGESEEVAPPRPWTRMTARPTAGFVLAAWFALQAASLLVMDLDRTALTALAAVAYGLPAIAFAASSLRLAPIHHRA